MSITAETIVDRSRVTLNDEESTYRWSDSDLVDYLNDAQYDLRSKLPEYWLDDDCVLQDLVEASTDDMTVDLLLPNKTIRGLSSFVVYKALSEDDSDTENLNRAAIHRQQYEELVR